VRRCLTGNLGDSGASRFISHFYYQLLLAGNNETGLKNETHEIIFGDAAGAEFIPQFGGAGKIASS